MKLNLIAGIGLAVASIASVAVTPANAAPSTFQRTCRNIKVVDNVLEATCRTMDGQWVYTNLPLVGVENINGNLMVTSPDEESSFHRTCRYTSMRGNILRANCQRRDGSWKNTAIALNGIENIDGSLRYTSSIIPQMF